MIKMKNIFLLAAIMIAVMTGCGKAWPADDPSQMPSIVFIMDVQYYTGDYEQTAIRFYDKNGQYYTSNDQEVCAMRFEELVKAYEDGELEDKLKRSSKTCDVDELFENYQKLCEVSKNEDLKIVYPEAVPAVMADIVNWYGLYYDEEGELQNLIIHNENYTLDFYTNDEQANEIYEWLVGTFQKKDG